MMWILKDHKLTRVQYYQEAMTKKRERFVFVKKNNRLKERLQRVLTWTQTFWNDELRTTILYIHTCERRQPWKNQRIERDQIWIDHTHRICFKIATLDEKWRISKKIARRKRTKKKRTTCIYQQRIEKIVWIIMNSTLDIYQKIYTTKIVDIGLWNTQEFYMPLFFDNEWIQWYITTTMWLWRKDQKSQFANQ